MPNDPYVMTVRRDEWQRRSGERLSKSPAILHGCADADCGYKTLPSTMGTPYQKCPLCNGPWIANPPRQNATTDKFIDHYVEDRVTGQERKTGRTVVRPHMMPRFNALEAAAAAKRHPKGAQPMSATVTHAAPPLPFTMNPRT